jgi:hypothetical protein
VILDDNEERTEALLDHETRKVVRVGSKEQGAAPISLMQARFGPLRQDREAFELAEGIGASSKTFGSARAQHYSGGRTAYFVGQRVDEVPARLGCGHKYQAGLGAELPDTQRKGTG